MDNVNHQELNEKNPEEGQPILADDQRIIVIGASAGGFEAFKKVISGLPADFATPIFPLLVRLENIVALSPAK